MNFRTPPAPLNNQNYKLTNRPEVALALAAALPGHLDEALVEAEIVPDGVLPALLVLLEEGKVLLYEVVDLAQSKPLVGAALNRHGDEGDVRVRRFRVARAVARRLARRVTVAVVVAIAAVIVVAVAGAGVRVAGAAGARAFRAGAVVRVEREAVAGRHRRSVEEARVQWRFRLAFRRFV